MTITSFQVDNISTDVQVHTLAPTVAAILDVNTVYWIVAQVQQSELGWNLGDSVFGQTAFRRPNVPWSLQENRNISAYAILGTPIPEPSNLALVGLSTLGMFSLRRRNSMPAC